MPILHKGKEPYATFDAYDIWALYELLMSVKEGKTNEFALNGLLVILKKYIEEIEKIRRKNNAKL